METIEADVIIIGSGPGGYITALKAAQKGLKVLVVDKNASLGGTCLNIGCIPSKILLDISQKFWEASNHFFNYGLSFSRLEVNLPQLMKRKSSIINELSKGISALFKKNNIQFLQGEAEFESNKSILVKAPQGPIRCSSLYIVIATGSVPFIPSITGLKIDEKITLTSTGALSLERIPQHLMIIGAGYIGLELGSIWKRLGSEVTIIDVHPNLLPDLDEDVTLILKKALEKQDLKFKPSTSIHQIESLNSEVILYAMEGNQMTHTIKGDALLVATGRKPALKSLNLEKIGLSPNKKGFLEVDASYQTSCKGIYAIGDVIEGPLLAHRAIENGISVAEVLAGEKISVNYNLIPSVMYTNPEVAVIGKTERELAPNTYQIGKTFFTANSRGKATGHTEGFVKIISDKKTDKVLGAQIIGPQAGTLISEITVVMEYGGSAEDIARTCHPHPTFSEALKEAAWATFDKALHS